MLVIEVFEVGGLNDGIKRDQRCEVCLSIYLVSTAPILLINPSVINNREKENDANAQNKANSANRFPVQHNTRAEQGAAIRPGKQEGKFP